MRMLLLVMASLLPAGAVAQETPLHKRVSVDYSDRDFADVLKDLGDHAGVKFVCPDELATGQEKVRFAATQQEVGRIARRILRARGLAVGGLDAGRVAVSRLDAVEQIRAKRAGKFEFAEKPVAVRSGDAMTIRFAVTDFCDVTIAIEDAGGRILRHLASGVLGENAPEPFAWNSKRQELVWDCKDDRGEYVRDQDLVVRVSLGLQARFERSLYWSPYKLGQNGEQPTFCPAPEGVYVYNIGWGRASQTPSLQLFDHDGRYVRTLYPFPAGDLETVQGLKWATYPPDGVKFPVKEPPLAQTSLLPWPLLPGEAIRLVEARMIMVQDKDYVYLLGTRALRIAKPGSGKKSTIDGPGLAMDLNLPFKVRPVPAGAALSPDGKWIYLTGYSAFYGRQDEGHGWPHYVGCVTRMPADGSKAPEVFLGEAAVDRPADSLLPAPCDVAVGGDGRVYVADMLKGLLIFSPEGKLLYEVKADTPRQVQIDPTSGDVWMTGWSLDGAYGGLKTGATPQSKANVILYRYKAGEPPTLAESVVLGPDARDFKVTDYSIKLDFQANSLRAWFANALVMWAKTPDPMWKHMNARVLEIKNGKAGEIFSFDKQTASDVVQSRPPRYARQRPYVNPADGCVYVAEQIQPTVVSDVQCFDQFVRIDPNTGRYSMVNLPFDSEDAAFDMDGLLYLRTDSIVARYDPRTWREVPFDYGQEIDQVTHYGLKPTRGISMPYFKGGRGASGKIFGMGVNARGDVAVSFYSTDVSSVEMGGESNPDIKRPEVNVQVKGVRPWKPRVYPGRSTYAFIHIWDRHGRMKFEDAVRGLGEMSDFKIDDDNNLYMVSNMVLSQYIKAHPDRFVNTLVKMPAGQARIVTDGQTPIPLGNAKPSRPPDAVGLSGYRGSVWLDGMEWALGGLGANARDLSARACHCEANCGIALDYYARSFVPAVHRYEVAVIDSAGNVVLRVGRYGNVEDGTPLVKEGGPAAPRPMGGDELALLSPKWLAVHSDRRLFISDRGNYRLASVKLSYHAEEKIAPQDSARPAAQ